MVIAALGSLFFMVYTHAGQAKHPESAHEEDVTDTASHAGTLARGGRAHGGGAWERTQGGGGREELLAQPETYELEWGCLFFLKTAIAKDIVFGGTISKTEAK